MGILLAFITYIGWGTGDIFGVYASRKIGAYVATAYVFIFGFLIASLYLPFAWNDIHKITPVLFVVNFVFGLGFLLANFLINEAFKRSNASLVGIIVQSFPAVLLILSTIIFKDTLTTKQAMWTIVIFVGVAVCTINFHDIKTSKIFTDVGILFAIIAACLLAIYFTFLRVFAGVYGWFWPNYISYLAFPVALFLIKHIFKVKEKITFPKSNKILFATFLSAFLIRGADITLNFGVSNGLAAIVAPIASASPTLFITLSSLIFKDPITKQQKIGIGICLLGIVLLSFFAK